MSTKLFFITPSGRKIETDGPTGESFMHVATAAGVPGVIGECGGGCSCGTCHVKLPPDWAERLAATQPPSALEHELLEFGDEYCSKTSRLSCQIKVTAEMEGMEVVVVDN